MNDLHISEMMAMQQALWERNRADWSPMEPVYGRNSILWMVEELGEVIAIIKKKEEGAIMGDPIVRGAFVEELADVLMYFTDVMLRYGVTAGEISSAFAEKHGRNIGRDYAGEYGHFLGGE